MIDSTPPQALVQQEMSTLSQIPRKDVNTKAGGFVVSVEHVQSLVTRLVTQIVEQDAIISNLRAEVESWVSRYQELDAWRAQTSKFHLAAESKMSVLKDVLRKATRYTITGEGASKGYFRLIEDKQGAWVTWAEVESLTREGDRT